MEDKLHTHCPVELLPCPFCGPGQSIVSLWHDDMTQRWRVGCGRCGASSGTSPRDKTEAPAIAAWNTRAAGGGPHYQMMETLSETDKDIALGQAVALAEYVVEAAKGKLAQAAEDFLSVEYARKVQRQLRLADGFLEYANRLGYDPSDGEGVLEFITRMCYEQGVGDMQQQIGGHRL